MSAFTSIFSENCVCECVSVRMGVHQIYFFRFSKIYTHFLYIEVASAFSFFLDWRQIYICSNDVIFDMICFLTETSLWNCFFFRLASVLRTNRIIVSINAARTVILLLRMDWAYRTIIAEYWSTADPQACVAGAGAWLICKTVSSWSECGS